MKMELIDKAAIIAEIQRRISVLEDNSLGIFGILASNVLGKEYNDILAFLDTLEVKEVDLEKEINKYISDNFFGSETMGFFAARTKEEPNDIDIALCAKYFYKLGLKAQKRE